MAIWRFSKSGRRARLGRTVTSWHRSQQIHLVLMPASIYPSHSNCFCPNAILLPGPWGNWCWCLACLVSYQVDIFFLSLYRCAPPVLELEVPHSSCLRLKLDWVGHSKQKGSNKLELRFPGFLEQCLVFPVPSVNGRRWMPRMCWPASSGNHALILSRWKRITSPSPRLGVNLFASNHQIV